MVDEEKSVVIMKNNRPKYIIIEFNEFTKDEIGEEKVDEIADRILNQNLEAFKELAK